MSKEIPFCQLYSLTIKQGAQYFGIGENKLRELCKNDCTADWILSNGNRTLIKRQKFEEFLDRQIAV